MATKEELDALGYGIVYTSSCSLIESCCLHVSVVDAGSRDWFDVSAEACDIESEEPVAEAVTYLEERGLIERHADNSDWVRLMDESEATA